MIVSESAFLIDTNVWIALTFESHPGHQTASEAVSSPTERRIAVFCRATQQSFLRLISTPALTSQYGIPAVTNEEALELLDLFMGSPQVIYQDETAGLLPIWRSLAVTSTPSPRLWMDAYLAAFAMAGGLQITTFDHGFASFQPAGLNLLMLQSR